MDAHSRGHRSWLVVNNDYRWLLDPRQAAFWVYIDGELAGIAPLGDRLTVPVDPGPHTVRVRLWWYRSPRIEVELKPGEVARFSADLPRKPLPRQIMLGLFWPFRVMSLKKTG